MREYKTIDVARMIGIHVNTVRLYEKWGLIPKPERRSNGYRVFTDLHVEQFKLARSALQVEVLQNGLRKQAVEIIKISARGLYDEAAEMTRDYLRKLDVEKRAAEKAIEITHQILSGIEECDSKSCLCLTRKETADYLDVTIDTLRNWELNGLFAVKRKENGYRVYSEKDIRKLTIIRSLRCANYSLASILRMLGALSSNPGTDIWEVIDTPKEDEDIITACDKLLSSLAEARKNALYVAEQIEKMKKMAK